MSQLGEQLIKDENIAVLELIKNSYDADAKNVCIKMENVNESDKAKIIIEDNGDGMSLDVVKNSWMEPGTDNKEQKLKKMLEEDIRSKLNRLPMGEKGIGRFGVHKLGNRITLITRAAGQKEVYLQIDWEAFNSSKYLSEVPINIVEREQENKYLSDSWTGTKIIIEKLKTTWTRGKIRDLKRAINSLNSPFEALDSFNVEFKFDNSAWLEGILNFDEIKEYALFKAKMTLEGDLIKNYEYNFIPWGTLDKLDARQNIVNEISIIKEEYVETTNKKRRKELIPVDLSKYNIGSIEIELLSFDLESSIFKIGGVSDLQGLKKYLKSNGGIFVYRDNIRIYSSEQDDWLDLGASRVNAPGDRISNNLVLGSVNLQRKDSSSLKEKTNREGFIEDEAYKLFRYAIGFAVQKFERDRALDKQFIRKYYSPTSKSEPVIAEIAILKQKVEKNIFDEKLKKEINGCLINIERDYEHITNIYQKSSSAGLSMSVVLHEIEKIISELTHAITAEHASNHVKNLVERLSHLTDGYSNVVKSQKLKPFKLVELINESLYMVDFRLQAHEIEIIADYKKASNDFKVRGNESLIASIIINIIDNSIWWLHYSKIEKKKIYINISNEISGYRSIIIADNGKGFTIPTEILTKPFITDKPGGMGLGLHLASELMKQHKGELVFPEFHDLSLPDEYKYGAILALSFKIET